MSLSDLPLFTVHGIRPASPDQETVVIGSLSHLRGVRNERGYLFRAPGPSIVGTLASLPVTPDALVEFGTPDAECAPELAVGVQYPWLDGYWDPHHVAMILRGEWERRDFHATPARYFRLGTVTGWQPANAPLMEGAEDLGVREGAWDHDHCELCQAKLGESGASMGFVDPDDHWLCVACYDRYAVARDVSFAAEA